MRRFAKRSICLLLTIVMLLGMLPTVALAAHDGSGRPLDLTGKVVLSLYTGNDFPGEPNTHTNTSGYVSFTSSFNKAGSYNNSYASSASTVLKSSILDNLIQGTNLVYWGRTYYVWGAYDTDGLTGYFTDNSIFENANVNKMIQAVKGDSASTATHEIVWYVIKYQTSDSAWHIDGIVREKANFSVNYYGNGNTGGGAPLGGSTYAAGTTYTILGNTGSENDGDLVRTVGGVEYEFIGWNTKDDGTGTSYKPGDTVTLNETNFPKHTLSLYAQWQAKNAGYTATVKTYLDSSLRDVSDIYGANDLTLHLSKDGGTTLIPLTHQGIDGTYTATGVANGTYTLYRKGSGSEVHRVGDYTLSISNSAGSLDVLHYSVAYDLNGGPGSAPAAANYISGTKVTVASGTPTRSGYYFLGWKDEDGSVYQPGGTLTDEISKRHRLTAQWEKTVSVTVNVTINHAGGNGYDQMETKDDVQLALVRRANSSSAYLETGNTLTLNKTSHTGFTYAENTNITTYTANGATFTDMPGGTAEYTVVTSKSGYDTTITPTKDANGNWIINVEMTYNPTNFDLNFTVNVDESVPTRYIPAAVIAKVTFWSSDRNRWEIITQHEGGKPGVRVDINPSTRSGAGSYPVWKYESNGTNPYGYRIQVTAFVYPDGTIIPASQVLQQDVKWSDNVYIAALGDVSSGRTYGTLSGAYFDDGSSAQKGTLNAKVTMPLYNVTFKANGGKIEAQDSLILAEQYCVPNLNSYVPVREGGYVFAGWYLDANGNGTLDAEETATVNSGDDLSESITLIAKWKEPLTIQGTVTVDGSYMQGSDYVDIKDADRPKDVQVRLWEVGHDGAIAVWEGNFGAYSVTNEIDTASVDYSFTGIPNDGTQYRIMVTITNYTTTYDHEPTDGTFSATEYTAVLNGDNKAVVNAHLSFEPESYLQKVKVDATAIAESFRPTKVLAEILYRNSGSTGAFARISQHEVAPHGIEIALTSGVGNGQDEVWKTLYNAMTYEYAVNISKVDGAAYSAADAPYQILYSGTTVWDNAHDELTGGEIDENGIYTGILKSTLVPREYKVNFDFNAGTDPIGGMGDYLHLDGNYYTTHKWSFDTPINAEPTRSGYVFAGWSCSTSGAYGGEKVAAATKQDITLTAQWKVDSNGDGVADENQTVVTFKVVNGAWNNGETDDKQVWVTLSGGSGTLSSGKIPTVGARPDPGYTTGSWAPVPNTADGGIIGAVTYTYTYALRSDLSYTVKHVVLGSGKVLKQNTVTGQKYNASVTVNAEAFTGYTVSGETTKTVTLTQNSTDIIFYYTPNSNIIVTFKHQKSDDSKLHDDTTLSNATMDSVLTLANHKVDITGYDYASTNALTYTVKATGNEVVLVYTPKTYAYTVEYYFDDVLDASRTVIGSNVYSSVINANAYVLSSVPTGYVLDTVSGTSLTIDTDESQNVIRFYYAKDTNSNGTPDKYEVTVTYKIFNGKWSDNTDTPKTATVVLATTSTSDGITVWIPASVTLGATTIPTGMTANSGYTPESGRWDEPIDSSTPVTADVTYNYRYHEQNKYYLVISTVNGKVTQVNDDTVDTAEYNVADVEHHNTEMSTFAVAANSGYALESVTVDGVEQTLATAYGKPAMPISQVDRKGNHAIVVTYGKDTNGDGIADCFQKPVTFKVVNGTWDSGSADPIYQWIPLKEGGAWSKSGSGDLSAPAADSKPAEHYKTGNWNTTPPP